MAIRLDAHRDEFHRDQQWHKPCRVATTANVTISTALNAGDTLDGVTLVAGDRVLVKDQSTGSQNGIYVVSASPARAYDMLAGIQAMGAFVYVISGTANGGKLFKNTNTSLPTIGSTALTFAEYGGVIVQDESTPLSTAATVLDFQGAGVTATGSGATKTITIPGGSGIVVQDEGTPLATDATTLNFTGSGVTASGSGATKTINVSGGGGGVGPYDINEYTGGDIALTSTSPAAVSGPTDLVVAASTGDLLFVGIGIIPVTNTAQSIGFDFASMVSGSPVNYLSSRTGTPVTIGCPQWFIGSAITSAAGGVVPYVVQAGDISSGNVTLRLYARVSGNRSINADAAGPLVTWVKNMLQ